jgi:hypothetical protein
MRVSRTWCSLVIVGVTALTAQRALSMGQMHKPAPFQVIQRENFNPKDAWANHPGGPQLGSATVAIEAEVSDFRPGAHYEFRATPLTDPMGAAGGWTGLEGATIIGTRLSAKILLPAGWYRLEVRRVGTADPIAVVQPFGIGEIFLIAGQSYAAGANHELLQVTDHLSRVVALDLDHGAWHIANDPLPGVGAEGTIWPAFGSNLAPLLNVPVAVVDVAVGGTASREWMPGETLYRRLVRAGKFVHRFRAVLWQQGESDVVGNTSTEKYVANLRKIRESAGAEWEFEAPWLLAKSTYHPAAYNNPEGEARIRDAIDILWHTPGFLPGPDTDILGGENRLRHFTGIGQRRAALMWTTAVWRLFEAR